MSRKWVLVTGGSRGIGAELVRCLSRQYDIVFTWLNNGQEETQLTGTGWIKSIQCDGRSEQQVVATAEQLLREHGSPYAIVHNSGICRDSLHIHQSSDSWQQVMDSNLNTVLYWNRILLPAMMLQGEGSLLLMSSVSGIKGNPGQSAYAASKAALIGMGHSLALELGRFGITVNCLLPGFIETDMTAALPGPRKEALRKSIPLRRFGTAQEVAQTAAFLLSEPARYITAQSIIIDGGMTA